ncbi:uncharacterized protein LOC125945824 [Dermacentor silvarum]|uniref:uncharacterized protein LOC125945824 n=1 Tax=Dermacentor silvarum TaxID=543639 RepID=UPI002100F8E3|nr:uncharacterized protein LOC125945824 [Dermacentor silvarum]
MLDHTDFSGNLEPSAKLAAALGCNVSAKSTWLSCFRDASVEGLLTQAARMELRFTPQWDAMDMVFPSAQKKPKVSEVLAGGDIAQARQLLEEYVKPSAKSAGVSGTGDEFLNYLVDYIIGPNSFVTGMVRGVISGGQKGDFMDVFGLLVTGCGTRAIAKSALHKGYHYLVDSGGTQPLFEPMLAIADVVRFLSHGIVPRLKDGQAWQPWKSINATRKILADGSEVLDGVNVGLTCDIKIF